LAASILIILNLKIAIRMINPKCYRPKRNIILKKMKKKKKKKKKMILRIIITRRRGTTRIKKGTRTMLKRFHQRIHQK
jgi:hypothetical protein